MYNSLFIEGAVPLSSLKLLCYRKSFKRICCEIDGKRFYVKAGRKDFDYLATLVGPPNV
jgi:hypothetical protein